MRLIFIGADHEVTGSCHFLEACGKNILVDYGMRQGGMNYERAELPVPPNEIDYVFLTHAHIDHSGLLPNLVKNGFSGQILATDATCDLAKIMLMDSAHIQEMEYEWMNRKNQRAGKEIVEPLYTTNDAAAAIKLLVGFEYGKIINLCEGIRLRFTDIGHMLGSSSIEVWLEEEDVQKKIVFSGDVGNINQPLIRDPDNVNTADYLVIESTYGSRKHEKVVDYDKALANIIQATLDKGGNLVIPSFAVGRTQELLYFIRNIKNKGLVKNHDGFKVYVDSPLAVEATTIFNKYKDVYFDDEAKKLVDEGINPMLFDDLRLSISSDDSKNINFDNEPKVIISASGMCDAGRIRHHLKHNLWRKDSTILFVGYQANGTLGRLLIDGDVSRVKLFGEYVEVNATITALKGMSGHADKNGLEAMVRQMSPKPSHIFIVHGDDENAKEFERHLKEDYGYEAKAPYSGSIFDLGKNEWLLLARPVALKKEIKSSEPYANLLHMITRLQNVADKNRNISNKDLSKFAAQIQSLCDKWDNYTE